MKNQWQQRPLNIVLVLSMLLAMTGSVRSVPMESTASAYVETGLFAEQSSQLSVIVTGNDSKAARRAVDQVHGQVSSDLWLIDAVAASIPLEQLDALAGLPGVKSIVSNKGVNGADASGWPGYVTNIRLLKSYYTLKSTQYNPVTYLPDGGFLSLGEKGNVLIINADGSQRAQVNLSGGPFYTAPVVLGTNGSTYIAGQTMRIYALNPDGSMIWQFAINGSSNKFVGGVALGPDGTVYAADNARWVYAIDGNTGKEKWRSKAGTAGANITTPAVGLDGSVYITTDKGYVHALNSDGTPRWTYGSASSLTLSPVLSPDGKVYVTSTGNKKMFVLDAVTGVLQWSLVTAGAPRVNPIFDQLGNVYLATEPGLYGLSPSGAQRFYYPASGGAFKTLPSLSSDALTLYIGNAGPNIFAVDTVTGLRKWVYTMSGTMAAAPILDPKGIILAGDTAYNFVVLDANGNLINSLKLTGSITQSPAASQTGKVVVRVGTASLATMDLLPSQWDGRPDVQATSNKNYYKLVNPVSIDIGANILHKASYGSIRNIRGAGVTIAVVDSGIYFDSDTINTLTGRINKQFLGQADYIDSKCAAKPDGTLVGIQYTDHCLITSKLYSRDGNGHGTMVAGAIWNNLMDEATGVTMGVAPDANIVSVRVMNNDGVGNYETVIKGIQWAVENKSKYGIRIMNLSISAYPTVPYFVDPLDRAVERAWQNDIVVVAAAGNLGPAAETITVPGNDPYVITVGAINEKRTPGYWADDTLPSFSSTGPTLDGFVKPDVIAPGSQIISFMYNACKAAATDPNCASKSQKLVRDHADYSSSASLFRMSGTSMATPIVSSVVAMMLQVNPNLTPDEVKFRLKYTARPAVRVDGDPVYSPMQQGNGRIWAPDAVLGVNFPAEKDNASMDINSDLAHNGLEFDYHYPGPVQRMISDNGEAFLYFVQDANGKVLALGAVRAADKAWLDRETIGMLTWNTGQWAWPGDSTVSTGGSYAWNGGSYAWNGGSYAWNGGSYAWNGGSYAWNGGSYAWNGGSYAWNGGSYAWNGGSYAWNGGSYAWNGGSYAWNGNLVDVSQELIGVTQWVDDP